MSARLLIRLVPGILTRFFVQHGLHNQIGSVGFDNAIQTGLTGNGYDFLNDHKDSFSNGICLRK
jgi:hypothetical protein